MSFTGEFYNTIDQKNRLSIPAKYRKTLALSNDKTFILTRGFDKCLFLYPLEEWKIVEGQLSSLSSIRGKNRNFIRSIVRYANYVKYDSQGRIQISDSLLKYANISKSIMVIGMIKKIELWDKNTLDKYEKNKSSFTDNDFDDLANKINF
jgi:MraZ protein